jgi:hypothetical protein
MCVEAARASSFASGGAERATVCSLNAATSAAPARFARRWASTAKATVRVFDELRGRRSRRGSSASALTHVRISTCACGTSARSGWRHRLQHQARCDGTRATRSTAYQPSDAGSAPTIGINELAGPAWSNAVPSCGTPSVAARSSRMFAAGCLGPDARAADARPRGSAQARAGGLVSRWQGPAHPVGSKAAGNGQRSGLASVS